MTTSALTFILALLMALLSLVAGVAVVGEESEAIPSTGSSIGGAIANPFGTPEPVAIEADDTGWSAERFDLLLSMAPDPEDIAEAADNHLVSYVDLIAIRQQSMSNLILDAATAPVTMALDALLPGLGLRFETFDNLMLLGDTDDPAVMATGFFTTAELEANLVASGYVEVDGVWQALFAAASSSAISTLLPIPTLDMVVLPSDGVLLATSNAELARAAAGVPSGNTPSLSENTELQAILTESGGGESLLIVLTSNGAEQVLDKLQGEVFGRSLLLEDFPAPELLAFAMSGPDQVISVLGLYANAEQSAVAALVLQAALTGSIAAAGPLTGLLVNPEVSVSEFAPIVKLETEFSLAGLLPLLLELLTNAAGARGERY